MKLSKYFVNSNVRLKDFGPIVLKQRILWRLLQGGGAYSANFDKKVHKSQRKSYRRIGVNMQLIFTHILWIWILLSVHHNFLGSEGWQGTHSDALNPFSSKSVRWGLWTFLATLALCAAAHSVMMMFLQ